MLHTDLFWWIYKYLEIKWHSLINWFISLNYLCKFENHSRSFLSRSAANPDPGGFPHGCWGFRSVVHFANKYAYVTFWAATEISKPGIPYQPTCSRSMTSRLRSVRLSMASASWCWKNWWNMRQNTIFAGFDVVCTLKLHYRPGQRHDFISQLGMKSLITTVKMAVRAITVRARDSKHQNSNNPHTRSRQWNINVTFSDL